MVKQYAPVAGTTSRSPTCGAVGGTPAHSTSPDSQCRPTTVTVVPPPTRSAIVASNRCPTRATSRLSAIPPSTATNVVAPNLTVVTVYTVTALLATTLRPGS